ncbi:MAG: hypothetical protein KDH94_00405 [Coxiellaceae bacterium]|nr:hypothetical protein [Coxiellaceae bacterium]
MSRNSGSNKETTQLNNEAEYAGASSNPVSSFFGKIKGAVSGHEEIKSDKKYDLSGTTTYGTFSAFKK